MMFSNKNPITKSCLIKAGLLTVEHNDQTQKLAYTLIVQLYNDEILIISI